MSEVTVFYPESSSDWRKWLEANHEKEQAVWIVFFKKSSGKPSLTWSEAVDQALCFGWIDSKKVSVDSEKSHQFFSRRKAKSTWSKINKEKIQRLTENGLMMPAGIASIETAIQNGSWTVLDAVEELIVPEDLLKELDRYPEATDFFYGLSKSVRKRMLYWIVSAKRPETRQKRISEIAGSAALKKKPEQFR